MGINLKKRICIYVIYDNENVIDDYIGYMLRAIRTICSFLVVVCNFQDISQGVENIEKYADKIFFRTNLGFDAGAYKDALCKYLKWDEIRKYDELVLVNDSFYGPFYSLEDVFLKMEKENGIDYWGMTRSLAGIDEEGVSFPAHIQSYFLCFKKTVTQNIEFQKFWENISYPETLKLAVKYFEIELNQKLSSWEFCGKALMDFSKSCMLNENENPYLLYPIELICNGHIPILKRKSLDLGNKGFFKAITALKYIESKTDYDAELIKKHLLRISQCIANQGMIPFTALEKFYKSHSKIYFYGAGIYGKNLAVLFEYLGWNFEGFLVTDKKENYPGYTKFADLQIGHKDGIIVTVGKKELFLEILKNVEKCCRKDQLLFPNYLI